MNNINIATQKYLKEKGYHQFSLKAVLFDMDGVLYDSMPNHAVSWMNVMQSHGFKMTEEEAYMHEGRTGDDTINILSKREGKNLKPEERRMIYQEKTNAFNSCPVVLPMKGSAELLQKVTGCGLFAMLVTGSGQPSLLDQLNNDFPNVFIRERMVTSFDVKKGKPHPEPYLTALEKGRLKPNEAIVIENAPLGVTAAQAAGLFTIAVNTGPLPDSILADAGANFLLPSIETLRDEWDHIFDCINTIKNTNTTQRR
ncbi:MAG: HAD-IA family hydrolase [Tannerella sp.]|jgi:beta-phosphoglucomutase-like phosphatase (HAD superfamily)|nr:HAD-IA family hydrolase [Tannerella sp.]